jgi:hypothetical protein
MVPEKIAAKGIEDEDVPLAATPTQAVVRVEGGMLIVRQRSSAYRIVTTPRGNQPVTSYQLKTGVGAAKYDAGDVVVFDMKGNRLLPKAWREKLKSDVHVLLGFDGKLPNPRELTLFRDDTLLVVLTAPQAGAANWGVAGMAPPTLPPTPDPPLVPQPRTNSSPSFVPLPSDPALTPSPQPATTPTEPPSVPLNRSTAPMGRPIAPPVDDRPPLSGSN